MAKSKFYNLIKNATIEKDVENVYTQGINMYFKDVKVEHNFGCDGFIDTTNEDGKLLKLIIEYKFDEDFTSKTTRAKVITQVLYYMKRFEENGLVLPNVVMVGDVNECFVLHTNDIIKYLDEDLDWSIAPSKAHEYNAELILKISEDETINPFIFIIDETFSFKDVVDKIRDLASNIQRYVHVTEHNIATIFEYFTNRVITNKKKIAANDIVAIFIGVITKNESYYKHPMKKNTLVTPFGDIKINNDGFDSFFSYFNRNYTPQEKNKFAEISDRLIEDTNRRNKGEFYTPTLFVDYAHKMIAEQFGEDWKEKYVVWDNCSGTKNLTRDYYFKELYCSTLENAELAISDRYNREGVSFQFDFLNDSLDKLPQGLKSALENNKPIIFFLNPPYATASLTNGSTKTGISNTKVYEEMKAMKMGRGAQNLYAQFLYRIIKIKEQYNLTDVHIALFSPTNYVSSPSFKKMREEIAKNFNYSDGMFFKASHFADVADSWGILFSIWNCGKNDKNEFITHIVDNIDGEIVKVEDKIIYNCDNQKTASDWVKESVKKVKTFDAPNFTNALKIKTEKTSETNELGKIAENAIGFFTSSANNVYKSRNYIGLFTSAYSDAVGCSILPSNFDKVCSFFSARDLCKKDWQYAEDEFLIPNIESEKWKGFVNDSIVYSLFSTKGQQSSLRQVEYKDKLWDIKNEFFFMSKADIMELANDYGFDFTFNDANVSNERYVYTKLQGIELSEEAKAVLDKAIELTKASFKYREMFDEEHPEYQIMNWDCGWYQIKGMLKEYMPEALKEFNELYKKLADKMRPMVYELGFLRQ